MESHLITILFKFYTLLVKTDINFLADHLAMKSSKADARLRVAWYTFILCKNCSKVFRSIFIATIHIAGAILVKRI